jgi:hypothetical protein
LLTSHKDGLVYHVCYTTPHLDSALDALESEERLSIRPIFPPKEAVLFGGKRVSFYLVEGVGLIEIIDEGS